MIDMFFWKALAGGAGVALVAGPVGCFVIWLRLAYFGSAVAHAALLGVALGFAVDLPPMAGVAVVCVAAAIVLSTLQTEQRVAGDALIGILAHGGLAAGLVAVSAMQDRRFDLMIYLFGDILALSWGVVALIWLAGLVLGGMLALLWRPLLSATAAGDIAAVEGVPVTWVRLALMLIIAIVIAAGMRVAGVLLTVSLLIIPAAAARLLAHTPETMARMAALIGLSATMTGLYASLVWNTPAGASIVLAATVIFATFFALARAVDTIYMLTGRTRR